MINTQDFDLLLNLWHTAIKEALARTGTRALDRVTGEGVTLEALKLENQARYEGLLPQNYPLSYVNPVQAQAVFGKDLGPIASYLAYSAHRAEAMAENGQVGALKRLVAILDSLIATWTQAPGDADKLTDALSRALEEKLEEAYSDTFRDNYTPEPKNAHRITMEADLTDLRYLYAFGHYVSDHELRTAQFLNQYDANDLDDLAHAIVKAYVNGFKRDNKDITKRRAVRVYGVLGQERLNRLIVHHLKAYNLTGYVSHVVSTEFNQQVAYDHKFDEAIYLTEAFNHGRIAAYQKAAKSLESDLRQYSGILVVERFGEAPFTPVNNDSRPRLNDDQQTLHQAFQLEASKVQDCYIPETERSFCIVAFPSPEIGDNFEAIFHDIVRINRMDSEAHERIQQYIIDALDKGDYVEVKGYKGNRTDIRVKLGALEDPSKQTNFVNCVADVNIPVGEVFTSPVLKGTSGLLHLDTVYLDGFNYKDLSLEFVDGYIDQYTCGNFDDEGKNRDFVRENLMFPHKTLPLGEFAIGTNTLAYAISEKYGIVDKLPVLIVEKMGPHFAIGDTCFSWSEDNAVYNPLDGKEVIARDNEHSLMRKEDLSKAYTNCHTDITIPYDSLERISVVAHDGTKTDIILHGRFVLEGTEALNAPLDTLKG